MSFIFYLCKERNGERWAKVIGGCKLIFSNLKDLLCNCKYILH